MPKGCKDDEDDAKDAKGEDAGEEGKGGERAEGKGGDDGADIDLDNYEAWGVRELNAGDEGGRATAADVDPIIKAACDFYFESPDFEERLKAFAFENCSTFDESQEEHSLGHTALFEEFKRLFESELETFIEQRGMSISNFYSVVAANMSSREFYSGSTFAHVVNAATDFENFSQMMCDARDDIFVWGMPPLIDTETGELY